MPPLTPPRWIALLPLLLAVPARAEFAPDGIALSLGKADSFGDKTNITDVQARRLGLTGPLTVPGLPERWRGWGLETGYVAELGKWHWDPAGNTEATSLDEFGLVAALRAHPSEASRFYLEAGTGIRLLSRSRVSGRELSTQFHFGSHGGAGIRFGPEGRVDAAIMLQHISNADIEIPNPGINFYQLRLIYRPGGSP